MFKEKLTYIVTHFCFCYISVTYLRAQYNLHNTFKYTKLLYIHSTPLRYKCEVSPYYFKYIRKRSRDREWLLKSLPKVTNNSNPSCLNLKILFLSFILQKRYSYYSWRGFSAGEEQEKGVCDSVCDSNSTDIIHLQYKISPLTYFIHIK